MENDVIEKVAKLVENDRLQDHRMDTIEERLTKQGEEIDTLVKSDIEQVGEIKLVRKDLEFINRTTQKTEDKLDKLSTQPLNRYRKIGEYVVMAIIGAVLAVVFSKIGLQ